LERDSPFGRDIQKKASESAKVISIPKIGGIQHGMCGRKRLKVILGKTASYLVFFQIKDSEKCSLAS